MGEGGRRRRREGCVRGSLERADAGAPRIVAEPRGAKRRSRASRGRRLQRICSASIALSPRQSAAGTRAGSRALGPKWRGRGWLAGGGEAAWGESRAGREAGPRERAGGGARGGGGRELRLAPCSAGSPDRRGPLAGPARRHATAIAATLLRPALGPSPPLSAAVSAAPPPPWARPSRRQRPPQRRNTPPAAGAPRGSAGSPMSGAATAPSAPAATAPPELLWTRPARRRMPSKDVDSDGGGGGVEAAAGRRRRRWPPRRPSAPTRLEVAATRACGAAAEECRERCERGGGSGEASS